MDCFTW